MWGLSSYGVILMCLYYLMETGQINFLDLSQSSIDNIDIGTIIPDIKLNSFLSLYENFIGFMDFYKEGGVFQRERKIACLLKKK
jgi:hypothetical protein